MPRTDLDAKAHRALVNACGGTFDSDLSLRETILGFPKKEMGNFGTSLKIAAIRAHYRVGA